MSVKPLPVRGRLPRPQLLQQAAKLVYSFAADREAGRGAVSLERWSARHSCCKDGGAVARAADPGKLGELGV
jgi:hypothetical protein